MLTEFKDPQGADDFDYVHFERETHTYGADEIANDARRLAQTLIERVPADARASLEAEIARLREENESLRVDVEMHTGAPHRRGDS
jgi:hypothetical protein